MLTYTTTLLPLLASLILQAQALASPFALENVHTLGARSAAAVQASPELQALTVDDGVSMQWTGTIFEGEQPVILYGTAKRIYDAIKVANPEFAGAEVPAEIWAKAGNATALSKRQSGIACAVMATGSQSDVADAASFLRGISGSCGAPSNDCRRMTCEATTGTYICSEFLDGTSIPCVLASDRVWDIRGSCCNGNPGRSGHYYPQDRDYSIWAGYADCNHPTNRRPNSYPYPGGSPNGLC